VQEQRELLAGRVLRENLVRLDALPLVLRVPSLPSMTPGAAVELSVIGIDLLDLSLRCDYRRSLDVAGDKVQRP